MNEYGKSLRNGTFSGNILISSHVKFTRHLDVINWREVVKSSLPFMNKDRMDYLMSLCGAYSLNPLLLITTVLVDTDIAPMTTDREFNHRLRQRAEHLARTHLDDADHPIYMTLYELARQSFEEDKFHQFHNIYSTLHTKYNLPLVTETDNLLLKTRDDDLKPSLMWPWRAGSCWELGPSHGGSIEGLTKYVPSALDMAPSLFNTWKHNFEFLGMTGNVHSSHSGIFYKHSTCNVEVKAGRWSTYYAHLKVSEDLYNGMLVQQGDLLGEIELEPDNALCLCDWKSRSYSCSTGPHLHWELRKDGLPESLDNMVVGGVRIKAGKYERDASCTDPTHCMFATDEHDNKCATYFVDESDTIFCPSVRGNTGTY